MSKKAQNEPKISENGKDRKPKILQNKSLVNISKPQKHFPGLTANPGLPIRSLLGEQGLLSRLFDHFWSPILGILPLSDSNHKITLNI